MFIRCLQLSLDCMQLAAVDSIGRGAAYFACCYTGNLAACYIQATADGCSVFTKHDGFCTIISTDIAHANTAVSNCKVFITIGNDDAIFIQVNFGISIGNRGNISQIACNINLVISLAVFNCRFNCCILTVRQGSMFTGFSCYSLQLVFSCSSAGSNAVFIPSSIGKTGYSTISTINSYGMSSTDCYAILQGDTIICYISCSISGFYEIKVAIYRYTCAFSIYGINGVSVGCGCFTYRSDVGTLNYLCLSCCTYLIQLAYVYSVGASFACCYAGNLATFFNGNIINLNIAAVCKADAACTFACAGDGLNASQLVFQRNANLITIIAYLNVSIAIKFNFITRFYIRCIALFSFQLPTLACASSSFTYLLQLCYVYCVSIFSTCCYIGNLTSNFFTLYRTAYRNSTISCLPSNTGFSFSSTIAKRVGSCACYAANAQSNAAFYAYACTIADSNCIISRNRILMTEGNNIAYAFDCVFVTHYNGIGNIGQCIVGACHEYIMADIFLTTDKPVIIADNGRIGLFGNSVGTADYCNGTALLFSENRIVTAKNS